MRACAACLVLFTLIAAFRWAHLPAVCHTPSCLATACLAHGHLPCAYVDSLMLGMPCRGDMLLTPSAGSVRGQNTPVTAQTVLDLYGDSVEPWDSTRTAAVQQAAAQSVGHGVAAGQVSVNVVTTYSQQQVGGERCR